MDWEKLTDDVVAAATASFSSLMSERAGEHFYAFSLYTDEDSDTISPAANSLERYQAKVLASGDTDVLQLASCKWATAEWAYEAWNAKLFTGIYHDLQKYRKTLPDSESDETSYKNSVKQCMISALKRMDENGFFADLRSSIVLFVSTTFDDEAEALENRSAKELNSESVYLSFIDRYKVKKLTLSK